MKREYLYDEELQKLQDPKLSIPRMDFARDIFLFSCYSGLAYIGVTNLKPDDIRRGVDVKFWIITQRKKTKVSSSVSLLPIPKQLIKKYKLLPGKKSENYIFPCKHQFFVRLGVSTF